MRDQARPQARPRARHRAPEIVSFERAFHGRTYGALAATPQAGQAGAVRADAARASSRSPATTPRRCAAAVGERTAAVLIEPIQGEAGVYPIADEALLAAREACDEAGALLILDEIQTGMGRTGSLWAYEQTAVVPDVHDHRQGARRRPADRRLITGPRPADVLEPGDHGSTFAGGPRRRRGGAGRARGHRRPGPAARRARAGRAPARRACAGSTGVARGARPRPDGRRRPRRGRRRRWSAARCSSSGLVVNAPGRARCACCRRWWSPTRRSTRRWRAWAPSRSAPGRG